MTLPRSVDRLRKLGPAAAEALPVLAREVIAELLAHLRVLDERIAHYDRQQRMLVRQSEPSQRLDEILGVGSATALSTVASVGNGTEFENGRQFSAWMGLVPRQWTTGGKVRLGHIIKTGDAYLRTLYVQAAKSALLSTHRLGDTSELPSAVSMTTFSPTARSAQEEDMGLRIILLGPYARLIQR